MMDDPIRTNMDSSLVVLYFSFVNVGGIFNKELIEMRYYSENRGYKNTGPCTGCTLDLREIDQVISTTQ